MNAEKDSYLINSKIAFLKSGQNAGGICPFFYGGFLEIISIFDHIVFKICDWDTFRKIQVPYEYFY